MNARIALSAAALVALIALISLIAVFSSGGQDVAPALGSALRSNSPTSAQDAGSISAEDLRDLNLYGDYFTPSAGTDAPVTLDEAYAAVYTRFNFLRTATKSSATLGSLTDSKYGSVDGSESSGTGRVKPLIEDREVWLLVFDNVTMRYHGPMPIDQTTTTGDADHGNTGLASMWFAVDAKNGAVLLGRSLNDGT